MNTPESKETEFPSIVIAYDTRDCSIPVLQYAEAVCARGPIALHAVLVLESGILRDDVNEQFGANKTSSQTESAQQHLADVLQKSVPHAAKIFVHVRHGKPAEEILDVAEECQAALIVVGSRTRSGLKRMLLGSVAEEVMHKAHCPVYLARETHYETLTPDAACPKCLETRQESGGQTWWCTAHQGSLPEPHVYSYQGPAVTREGEFIIW